MPKFCSKFMLDKEFDGEHYYSGIDGSLYHPQEEKMYQKEEYCVDYFFDKEDEDDPIADDKVSLSSCEIISNKIFVFSD